MVDMGFEKDIRNILNQLPKDRPRLTAMFSATFPKQIRALAQEYLASDYLLLKVERIGEPTHSVKQEIRNLDDKDKWQHLTADLKHNQGLTLGSYCLYLRLTHRSLCRNQKRG